MRDLLKISAVIIVASFGAYGLFGAGYTTEEVSELETVPYSTETIYDATIREGITEVRQEGVDGAKTVTYLVTSRFGKETDREISSQKLEKEPVDKVVIVGTKRFYACSNGVEYETLNEKEECEKRLTWEANRNKALAQCYADSSKFDCWYDAYPGTTLHWSYYTYSAPSYRAPSNSGTRYGAICMDGTRSSATGRGACSHHGGVSMWLTY